MSVRTVLRSAALVVTFASAFATSARTQSAEAACPSRGEKFIRAAKNPFEKRTALVIGNEHYCNIPGVKRAIRDAQLVADVLQNAGFDVTLLLDADLRASKAALSELSEQSTRSAASLIYFAGLGNQIGEEYYAHPTDITMNDLEALRRSSLSLYDIVSTLEHGAPTRIVVLDSSRSNPFPRTVAQGTPRRTIPPITGLYLGFSTAPGGLVPDNPGADPFASAFVDAITSNPGSDIEDVFRKVRAKVVQATNGAQIPWTASSLLKFSFIPTKHPPAPAPK